MKLLKDTRCDENAAAELTDTVQLATQALNGRQLSDRELERLCDTALSKPVRSIDKAARPSATTLR